MKYDVSQTVLGYNGEPFQEGTPDKPRVLTLKDMLERACTSADPQRYSTGEQKVKIFKVLTRVHAGGIVVLTAEDVQLLKELVGSLFTVAAVGAIYEILENPYMGTPESG